MRKRCTEDQIVKILQEAAAGGKVAELCRKHGGNRPPSPVLADRLDL